MTVKEKPFVLSRLYSYNLLNKSIVFHAAKRTDGQLHAAKFWKYTSTYKCMIHSDTAIDIMIHGTKHGMSK